MRRDQPTALPSTNLFGEATPEQAPPKPSLSDVYHAYERSGGKLDVRARSVLGRQAKHLLGEGYPLGDIASAAGELGATGSFPAYLGRTLRERPKPCVNGTARLRLTFAQLTRCKCDECKEWATLRAEKPLRV